MSQDAVRHLHTLKDQAITQSAQISDQLNQGISTDKLVPLLQKQAETIKSLQAGIQELSQSTQIVQHKDDIKILQQTLKELAEAAQEQVQKTTQKGVRLTGIGGKPHISRRKPNR
ncbi:MAG: hypothetical protein HOE48_25580 [Candidatus Latescibacteria bacterium]|jgi:hypothetical protein|nr:hypothetical protein [Candidatus Latescibacterota bacterium]MBT4141304.1 hypothetical protein [Candidatus Latescibacterota bacterium]MBT5831649.1 hypothetical protein [Candidatus Latescibacterota bacterium]